MNYHKYSRKSSNDTDVKPYWLSISDLMAGVLIIFILFFVLKINNETKLRRVFEELFEVKEKIVSELKEEYKDDDDIEVLEDGTVRFYINDKEKQWFEIGNAELKRIGKSELKSFIKSYIAILFSERYINYVDKIIIEGHTDSRGKKGVNSENENYLYNLQLSQKRAYNVAQYIHKGVMLSNNLEINSYYKEILREKLTANGRSYIDIIKNKNGEENRLLSRRVEFKFRLPMEEKYLQFRNK